MKSYITHTTENYEGITLNLVRSIKKYSQYPIRVYTIDYDATEELSSLAKCVRLDLNLPEATTKDFVTENGNTYVRRETLRTFLTLSAKIDALLHASLNGVDEWIYLDSDCIANYNVDDLFSYSQNVGDYPLASMGPLGILFVIKDGITKGNPWWKNDGTYDSKATLEWPLMEYLEMNPEQRGDYCTTNIIVGNSGTVSFLELWKQTKEEISKMENFFHYAPLHEETIYNVLTWRIFDSTKTLPMSYINLTSSEAVQHFFNTTVDKDTFISTFYKLPKDKSKIKIFHGEKRNDEIQKIFQIIDNQITKKMKVLFLAPHLSTGGMPGFLLKRIQTLQRFQLDVEIFVVEYQNLSNEYVVQKNQILNLIPKENFFSLSENKLELIDILKKKHIDIVHVDDMVEALNFDQSINSDLINELYSNERTWRIIETCHNVSFQPHLSKIFNPDAYAFCSPWHKEKTFSMMKSKGKLIQFPIDNNFTTEERKEELKRQLGLDLTKKHVVNVGLWTPGKNQREGIKIAKLLEKSNPEIQFHFVGNLASNFEQYWGSLIKKIPSNVVIWGERSDASLFIQACDVFMFNSTWECNPLVLREAISYGKNILARNLKEYMGVFNDYMTPVDDDVKLTSQKLVDALDLKVKYKVDEGQSERFAQEHHQLYLDVMNSQIQTHEVFASNITITNHFIEQPFLEIRGNSDSNFLVKFFDENGECAYVNTIQANHWVKLTRKYYTKWTVKVWENGEKLIYNKELSYKNQRVYIAFDSKSLGDTISWIPYALEFQKKHECKVIVSTFWNKLFKKSYPELEFIEPGESAQGILGMYKLGWFYDDAYEIELPNTIPLQKTATNILGLDFKETKPRIYHEAQEKPIEGKYVTIATNSTAGLKFWTRDGWQELVNYLIENGYQVVNVSKEDNPFRGVQKLRDTSIENTMNYIHHSEFFIGLSSGLSWLAWGMGKNVVMISNFTEDNHEFVSNCVRITNKKVCNGCWNNPELKFDRGDWNWCPLHKNTERQFECHTSIKASDVIEKMSLLLNDRYNKFNWGWMDLSETGRFHKIEITKETFQDRIYEKFFEVENGDIVLDIGASVGPFTYSILNKNPKHVFAIEPSENEFITLVKNTKGFPVTQILKGISSINGSIKGEHIYSEDNLMEGISFKKLVELYDLSSIDFMKTDCEGGEYDVFTDENFDYIVNHVKKISGEWHLSNVELKSKFRNFRDLYLNKLHNFEVFSVDGINIKWDLWNDHFIDFYTEVIIYIDNRK
jgi:autotransporter strand-loop-strand O-heptosyltransferase